MISPVTIRKGLSATLRAGPKLPGPLVTSVSRPVSSHRLHLTSSDAQSVMGLFTLCADWEENKCKIQKKRGKGTEFDKPQAQWYGTKGVVC